MPSDDDNQSDIDEKSGNDEGQFEQCDSNVQWLDSIANILKTNNRKGSKKLVLSKAKKLCNVETKLIPAGFEVAAESGEVKAEHVEKKVIQTEEPKLTKKRKQDILSVRMKPNILDRDRERILAKIATKGVVQLFNAVRMQQKDINAKITEAGPMETRRENALKSIDKKSFLNILMGKKSETVSETHEILEKAENKNVSWSVLKDDYMMSAKLKDWDKEVEKEVEMES